MMGADVNKNKTLKGGNSDKCYLILFLKNLRKLNTIKIENKKKTLIVINIPFRI